MDTLHLPITAPADHFSIRATFALCIQHDSFNISIS